MDPSINPDASDTNMSVNNESGDSATERETSPSLANPEQEVNKPLVESASESVRLDEDENPSNQTTTSAETELVANGSTEPGLHKQTKKAKKNVNFPVDSTIIKNYLEPPDPWKNGTYISFSSFVCYFHVYNVGISCYYLTCTEMNSSSFKSSSATS